VPKNHDLWAALGVCKVKNRLIGDFLMFLREAQQTPIRKLTGAKFTGN
jgi:hypothetical protein